MDTIRDSEGILPGATVLVKGTSIGIVSNENGFYKIEVPNDKNTLVFNSFDCETKEVKIQNKDTINIVLISDKNDDNFLLEYPIVHSCTRIENRSYVGPLKIQSSNISSNNNVKPPQWSIGIGAGAFNVDLLNQMNKVGGVTLENGNMFYLFGSRNLMDNKLSVTFSVLYNYVKGSYQTTSGPPFTSFNYRLQQYGVMIGTSYNWLNKGKSTISSGVDFGWNVYVNNTEGRNTNMEQKFVYQINAFQYRFGKKIGAFVNLGYGIKGIAGVGLDFRF